MTTFTDIFVPNGTPGQERTIRSNDAQRTIQLNNLEGLVNSISTNRYDFIQSDPPNATEINQLWLDSDNGDLYIADAIGTGDWRLLTTSEVIDNLLSTSTTASLSANQGRVLKVAQDLRLLISDVIDNLTSTDTDKALSANQGRVLKVAQDLKAPLLSPSLTGTPTAPTAPIGTDTTQIATTQYVKSELANIDVVTIKGGVDCSTNPNFPAADAGYLYFCSVSGKIGGASGPNVEANDTFLCVTDSSPSGDFSTVGSNWIIGQVNIDLNTVVLKSEVVNNLLSTLTNVPLAANQGRILQANIDAITGVDFNPQLAMNRLLSEVRDRPLGTFEGLIRGQNSITNQFTSNVGIDYTNSENVFYTPGEITNDGIGGFFTKLYTGTGAELLVTGVGFQPDFVWIKNRDQTDEHNVYDVIRGATNSVDTSATTAQLTNAESLKSFDADGFTVGTLSRINAVGEAFVAWCFECPIQKTSWIGSGSNPDDEYTNPNIGMSIVNYIGTGVAHAINHNLGATPGLMIVKNYSATTNWSVYHQNTDISAPQDKYMVLNTTDAVQDSNLFWDDTAPDSTTFTVGTNSAVNGNTNNIIAYLFTEVPGFSKFGTYEGNGTSQSITGLGFEPKMIIIKDIDNVRDWRIIDDVRGSSQLLFPNSTVAEVTSTTDVTSIDSDGFSIGSGAAVNSNGQTYIYITFGAKGAANDLKLVSDPFGTDLTSGPNSIIKHALIKDLDSSTLNTDLIVYGSRRQNAATQPLTDTAYWTPGTITKYADINSSVMMISSNIDVSSQTDDGVNTELRVAFSQPAATNKKLYFNGLDFIY